MKTSTTILKRAALVVAIAAIATPGAAGALMSDSHDRQNAAKLSVAAVDAQDALTRFLRNDDRHSTPAGSRSENTDCHDRSGRDEPGDAFTRYLRNHRGR